jgi:chemotaxis protein methyltransferase CheR
MKRQDTESSNAAETVGLTRLAEMVVARMGLHFPDTRHKDLLRGARALAKEQGAKDPEAYLQSLVDSPLSDRQIEILTAHLTVGETYFFREMKSLDAFRDHVIPELLGERTGLAQRLRIWSAGCSTGEEAYSIAMLLSDMIPDLHAGGIHILATDINAQALEKARRGVYSEWSFRSMPDVLRGRYFTALDPKTFAIKPRFAEMVSFAGLNLATDLYPSLLNETNAMDVIFCRNVLMYLDPDAVLKIIEAFHHCLVEGGWLIVAPSETSLLRGSAFVPVSFEGATLYRKTTLTPPSPPEQAPKPPAAAPPTIRTTRPVAAPPPPPPPIIQPPTSLYETAAAAYHAGRYVDAAAMVRTLINAGPPAGYGHGEDGKAFALMARIDANQGKLDQALEWANKAIAADKINPGCYYLLATILEEQNRPSEAVQALSRALYLDPAFVLAHYTLGTIALREQGRQAAARHFQNASAVLIRLPKHELLPESEGMTAGRLLDIIGSMTNQEGTPS